MKMLWRLSREAIRYRTLYIIGIAGTRTIIAIAHRLSTIRNADRILVIEEGRVTEEGTHGEPVAPGGSYARMNRIRSTATAGIA